MKGIVRRKNIVLLTFNNALKVERRHVQFLPTSRLKMPIKFSHVKNMMKSGQTQKWAMK